MLECLCLSIQIQIYVIGTTKLICWQALVRARSSKRIGFRSRRELALQNWKPFTIRLSNKLFQVSDIISGSFMGRRSGETDGWTKRQRWAAPNLSLTNPFKAMGSAVLIFLCHDRSSMEFYEIIQFMKDSGQNCYIVKPLSKTIKVLHQNSWF